MVRRRRKRGAAVEMGQHCRGNDSLVVEPRARIVVVAIAITKGQSWSMVESSGAWDWWRLSLPGQIGMLPLFLELKAMGLVNSYAGALVPWLAGILDRKSTRLNSSHYCASRMPSSACKKKLPNHDQPSH